MKWRLLRVIKGHAIWNVTAIHGARYAHVIVAAPKDGRLSPEILDVLEHEFEKKSHEPLPELAFLGGQVSTNWR